MHFTRGCWAITSLCRCHSFCNSVDGFCCHGFKRNHKRRWVKSSLCIKSLQSKQQIPSPWSALVLKAISGSSRFGSIVSTIEPVDVDSWRCKKNHKLTIFRNCNWFRTCFQACSLNRQINTKKLLLVECRIECFMQFISRLPRLRQGLPSAIMTLNFIDFQLGNWQ